MTEQGELLPCPFCGDKMQLDSDLLGHVYQTPSCPLKEMAWGHRRAVKDWNTRAAIAAMQPTPQNTTCPTCEDGLTIAYLAGAHDAKKVTPQQAAKVLLGVDENGNRKSVYDACVNRVKVYKFDAVLSAIASEDSK